MAYDPPTHQVWVKIVGLPSQAWTTTEIIEILRRFGQPTQILPFGRETGNYEDIIALVETKHPSRIPLAYMYHEGDYSIQVDILLLTWRAWSPDYFPPPGNSTNQHPHPPHPNSHQQNENPLTPLRNPSSSSSNGAPSEPTIDYSSWSPRRFKPLPIFQQKWQQKNQHPSQNQKPNSSAMVLIKLPASSFLLSCYADISKSQVVIHQRQHGTATVDQTVPPNFQGTHPLIRISSLNITPLPNHIHITLLSLLHTIDLGICPLRQARGHHPTLPYRSHRVLSSSQLSPAALTQSPLALLEIPHQPTPFICQKVDQKSKQGPAKPNTLILYEDSLTLAHTMFLPIHPTHSDHSIETDFLSSVHSPQKVGLPLIRHLLQITSNGPAQIDFSQESQMLDPADPPQDYHISEQYNPPQDSSISDPKSPHFNMAPPFVSMNEDINHQNTNLNVEGASMDTASLPLPAKTYTPKRSNKGKTLPTRRSQRLQTRQTIPPPVSSQPEKTKAKITKFPFHLDPNYSPIEVHTTLTILQASGLKITDQIENMVRQATIDITPNSTKEEEEPTPSTPLHDHIPPLTLPGIDIML